MKYFLNEGQAQVSKVGYVPLDDEQLVESRQLLEGALSAGAGVSAGASEQK